MSKTKRLRDLEESFEAGLIKKEEYEKAKKEIEKEKYEFKHKNSDEKPKEAKGSDKSFLIVFIILMFLFFSVFFIIKFSNQQLQPKTIEEMHELNFDGKLKPEQGYLYKDAYSFINLDGFWYTQLTSPSGKRLYNMNFRYGARDVEDINIQGYLDTEMFNNATEYYVTFNPLGEDHVHVALAIGDFNDHMIKVFNKKPIAACDREVNVSDTAACENRPIITCENSSNIVLYVKESEQNRVRYDNNCILVEGNDFFLVKGVDKVLFDLYGIK